MRGKTTGEGFRRCRRRRIGGQRPENLQGGRRRKFTWRWWRRRIVLRQWWAEVVNHVRKLLCQELLEATVGELRAGAEDSFWRWGRRQSIGLQALWWRRWEVVGLLQVLLQWGWQRQSGRA